tara:strand:+ start:1044 stop:1226 length:183 start_codon:yes stop_codon:yes gene_type:complete
MALPALVCVIVMIMMFVMMLGRSSFSLFCTVFGRNCFYMYGSRNRGREERSRQHSEQYRF